MKITKLLVTFGLCITAVLSGLNAAETKKNISEYDANGNVVHEILEFTADGHEAGEYSYSYNEDNKVIKIQSAENKDYLETFNYDENGNLINWIIEYGTGKQIYDYKYNKKNLIVKRTITTSCEQNNAYNEKEEEIFKYDRKGNMISYEEFYYALDLEKNEWVNKQSVGKYKLKYNSSGKLIHYEEGMFISDYEYDENDNLIMANTTSVDGSASGVTTYSFDEKGNIEQENHITKVSNSTYIDDTTFSYEYYEDGKIKTRTAVQTCEVTEAPETESSDSNWWFDSEETSEDISESNNWWTD